MSYQVLARKWRPRRFAEMVGQQHVLRPLINALDQQRLHHAFLFTGTRGVGKTSIARIFARSLNCEQGISSQPCGVCDACREIDDNRFVDLIEVDAASRTKVEDTRELLENVPYAPTRGRFKVYLIDEVHMLSISSFNALLKTLEEPPPHVKFLLATTDPQKLPPTILSRCLQFNLKRLPVDAISGHLAYILQQEGVNAEPEALAELARAADGSLRDALSLLDQAIADGGGVLTYQHVAQMVGSVGRQQLHALLQALIAADGAALFAAAAELEAFAPDYGAVLAHLAELLQQLAVAREVPAALNSELPEHQMLLEMAPRLAPEQLQLDYQIAITGRRDLPLAPTPRSGFEMTLLRLLAFRPRSDATPPRAPDPATHSGTMAAPSAAGSGRAHLAPTPAPTAGVAETDTPPWDVAPPTASAPPAPVAVADRSDPPPPAVTTPQSPQAQRWAAVTAALPIDGLLKEIAVNSTLLAEAGDHYRLRLDPKVEAYLNSSREQALTAALTTHFGRSITLSLEVGDVTETPAQLQQLAATAQQQQAVASITADPQLATVLAQFDGHVVTESIRPYDEPNAAS